MKCAVASTNTNAASISVSCLAAHVLAFQCTAAELTHGLAPRCHGDTEIYMGTWREAEHLAVPTHHSGYLQQAGCQANENHTPVQQMAEQMNERACVVGARCSTPPDIISLCSSSHAAHMQVIQASLLAEKDPTLPGFTEALDICHI